MKNLKYKLSFALLCVAIHQMCYGVDETQTRPLDTEQLIKLQEIDTDKQADPTSARVEAIMEICGVENGKCIINFWSASDEEVDAAFDEYKTMSGEEYEAY